MKTVKFYDLDSEIQKLIESSITIREQAYAPYSNFKVGASILCEDGTLVTGCNIENSAYALCTCAERTATVKAISEGHRSFKSLVVCAILNDDFVSPCGSCRQTVAEFVKKGTDLDVYLVKPDKNDVLVTSIRELLPLAFMF